MTQEEQAATRFARIFMNRLDQLQKEPDLGQGRVRFDELWPHIRLAHQRLAARPGTDDELCAQYPMTALTYWRSALPATEQRDRFAAALDAATRQRDTGTAGALAHHLGFALLGLDDPAGAAACFEQALDISQADGASDEQAMDMEGLARAYLELGWTERAVHHLRRGLDILRMGSNQMSTASTLRTLGRALRQLNRLGEGHQCAVEAARLMRAAGAGLEALVTLNESMVDRHEYDPELLAMAQQVAENAEGDSSEQRIHTLHDIARTHLLRGAPEEAAPLLETALQVARNSGLASMEMTLLGTFAELAGLQGDLDRAIRLASDRLRLAEAYGQPRQWWMAQLELGNMYRRIGAHEQALELHEQALRTARNASPYTREENPRSYATAVRGDEPEFFFGALAVAKMTRLTLAAIGHDHVALGDRGRAIESWESATAGASSTAEDVRMLAGLAMAYADGGRLDDALQCHERQLALIRKREDRAAEADAVGEMANVHAQAGRLPEAIQLYRAAYVIDLQIGNWHDMVPVLTNLAGAESASGRPHRASAYAARALEIVRRIGISWDEGTARAVASLATAGDPTALFPWPGDSAVSTVEKAADVLRADGYVGAADAAGHLGVLLFEQRRFGEALAAFQESLTLEPDNSGMMINVGQAFMLQSEWLDAREAFRAAARAGNKSQEAGAQFLLGQVLHSEGRRDEAAAAFRVAAASGDADLVPSAQVRLAHLALSAGNLDEAEEFASGASTSGDRLAATQAAVYLAEVRRLRGDHDGARSALGLAMTSPDRLVAIDAQIRLGEQLSDLGASREAEDLWAAIGPTAVQDIDLRVAYRLAGALLGRGATEEAKTVWRDRFGDRAGEVLLEMVDRQPPSDRRTMLEHALAIGDSGTRKAVVQLASSVVESPAAADLLQGLAAADDPETGPSAALALGVHLSAEGAEESARAAFEQALNSGHPQVGPHAAYEIGVREERQDLATARDWYQRAVDFGESKIRPYALVNLGAMHCALGDFDSAEKAFVAATESDNAEQAGIAWANIGRLRMERGDRLGAEDAWHRAQDGGPRAHRAVMEQRAALLADRDERWPWRTAGRFST